MWIFKYKFDENEFLMKFRSRLCVKRDLQQINQDIYAVTLIVRIFRFFMTLMTAFDLKIRQFDAVNVFANSPINESTYCRLFEEWIGSMKTLLLLKRIFYDLKQSSALGYKHLSKTLRNLKFDFVSKMKCLFMNQNIHILLFFFVDNIVVIYEDRYTKKIDAFQTKLYEIYEMKFLDELQWFLKIKIIQNRVID